MKLGIIGFSPGNGHPYSFSAIVNGYDAVAIRLAGWTVIADYLDREPPSRFGVLGARVTHAWSADPEETDRLCGACGIDVAADSVGAMAREVDAAIVALDDADAHWELARPFLELGKPVFVDKPLAVRRTDLDNFEPFLRDGLVMSCSGLRFCTELDELRDSSSALGKLIQVDGTTLNDWSRYGIHVLEALLGAIRVQPTSIRRLDASHEALSITTADGPLININCLGDSANVLRLCLYGSIGHRVVDLQDNFSAFRRLLERFLRGAAAGVPPIEPEESLRVLRIIIAGASAERGGRAVAL